MLVLPNSRFLHVPKTGGKWIKKAIIAAGIPYEEHFRPWGCQHITLLENPPHPELFTFAFVRHPLRYWQSYWRFKMGVDWNDPHNGLDKKCRADDFETFMRNVLSMFYGECSKVYERFVGPPDDEIEFVGKFENLVEDLITALALAGEKFDPRVIRATAPTNVSDKKRYVADYSPELERDVRKAEQPALERFDYN